jgi:hypothetical protein
MLNFLALLVVDPIAMFVKFNFLKFEEKACLQVPILYNFLEQIYMLFCGEHYRVTGRKVEI